MGLNWNLVLMGIFGLQFKKDSQVDKCAKSCKQGNLFVANLIYSICSGYWRKLICFGRLLLSPILAHFDEKSKSKGSLAFSKNLLLLINCISLAHSTLTSYVCTV